MLYSLTVPPSKPLGLTTFRTTTSSISLLWSPPMYVNGSITYYTVRCESTETIGWSQNTTRLSANTTNLLSGSIYTCCVSATNTAGRGEQSCIHVTTKEGTLYKILKCHACTTNVTILYS